MSQGENRVTLRCQSPISRISVEILCSIFSFSRTDPQPHLGSFDVHRQNLSVVQLTEVCHHWRSVAIDHATLWSNIAFTTSALPTIYCATTFLKRSKGASLYVHIWEPRRRASRAPTHNALAHLLFLISSQRNRIVLLEVINPSTRLDTFQGPAENLSRLVVQGCTPMEWSGPFFAKLPNVQQITLICPTPCRLGSLANLTQVTLHNGPRRWDVDAFLDCVDGCFALSSLSVIRYLSFRPVKDSARVVSLPSLDDLRLDTSDAATILGHLKLPATAFVSVCVNVRHAPKNFDNIFSCLPSQTNRINFLQNTGRLTIVFDKSHADFHISGFNGATPVFLLQLCGPLTRLDDDWVHRSLGTATNVLSFSGMTSLTLVVESADIPWESWLGQSSHLSTLDVCCPDLGGLAAALNRVQSDIPLCRTLRNLLISVPHDSWFCHGDLLRSAILLRKACGGALSSLTMDAGEWDGIRRLNPTWTGLVRHEAREGGSVTLDMA